MDVHRCRFVDYTPGMITALAFSHKSNETEVSPKQLRLAVGRSDGSIEIWNPRNSKNKWLLESTILGGSGRSIEGLLWATIEPELSAKSGNKEESLGLELKSRSRDGGAARLFSIGGSTYLTEWDIRKGLPLKNYDCNSGIVWSSAINESQTRIAVGCDNGSVVIVDISGGPGSIEYECVLQRQQSRIMSICWVGDDTVIGGCADGRIRVWSYKGDTKGRLIQTLRVDKSKRESTLIWSLLALPRKQQFVSGDSTGCVKIWDLKHMTLQQSFNVHEADVLCLSSDSREEHFFSGGVDRKIFNFTLTKSGYNSAKWVNTTNRLLHGNDIRAMCSFESSNQDLLASGGVERVVLVTSMEHFQTSVPLRITVDSIERRVLVNKAKRLIVMWQGQEVKIWKLQNEGKAKRLVCKLVLSDPENISSVALSKNGRYLAVSRISTTKLFELVEVNRGIEVVKVVSTLLSGIGARIIKFVDEKKLLLMVDSDGDVTSVKFNVNDDENDDEDVSDFDDEQQQVIYEMPETPEPTPDAISFDSKYNYTHLTVNSSGSAVAFSNFAGFIDILNTTTGKASRLVHMSEIPTAISFTSRDTLLVVTLSHKVYEFNTENAQGANLYTEWSRNNTEFIPRPFQKLPGECLGIFECLGKFWVYGSDWLCFFDSKKDFPRASKQSKKRSANGESASSAKDTSEHEEVASKVFWRTSDYRSLILVANLSKDELVVVERPVESMPAPTPFKVSRIAL